LVCVAKIWTGSSTTTQHFKSTSSGGTSERWRVRECHIDEIPDVAQIQFEGFHEPLPFGPLNALSRMNFRAEVVETLRTKMKIDSYSCLVVENTDTGLPGGVADVSVHKHEYVLKHLPDHITSYAYLSSMAVAAEVRRRGAAQALLKTAERLAAAWGEKILALHLHEGNTPAQRLYQRAGFRLVSRDAPFMARPRLLLVKDLK